ncbi:hypothetical protein [Aeromicrobium sp. Root495]|uniref:hypothetical protein n=1 Tax=Aeromicrobium sp. Root495 TaxID=1736550 RepID=UPI000AA20232|nr:hypothetical protein [Aeromicrobium sp. Root495]
MATWWITLTAVLSTLLGPGDTHAACRTLGALDVRRAEAFAGATSAPLRKVYVDERAAEPDRALVRDYRGRGMRLVGMSMVRTSCEAAAERPGRVRLQVVETLGPTWAVDRTGQATALPKDRPTRRVVTLVEVRDGWRVARVR